MVTWLLQWLYKKNEYISSSVSVHSKDFRTRRESFFLKFTVSNP